MIAIGAAAGILVLWGIAHILPVRAVVRGFGRISPDSRRILAMEWVAEGLALVFLGINVALFAWHFGPAAAATRLACRIAAGMLVVMAAWTALTGARTRIIPIKLCPLVKLLCAALLLFGSHH